MGNSRGWLIVQTCLGVRYFAWLPGGLRGAWSAGWVERSAVATEDAPALARHGLWLL